MPKALMKSKHQCLHSATEGPREGQTHSWIPRGGGVGKVGSEAGAACSLFKSLSIFSKLPKSSRTLLVLPWVSPESSFRFYWKRYDTSTAGGDFATRSPAVAKVIMRTF